MSVDEIVAELRAHANPANVAGMARFGINPRNTLGLSIPFLRKLAKQIGRDLPGQLAQELWATGIHEARILAAFVDDPALVGETQLEAWVRDFDSWDVCDQVCSGLFDRTRFAHARAVEWSSRPEEFVKRAGFVLMARLAVSKKNANDNGFLEFFQRIEKEAHDDRPMVRKAVNWALRQIGKRSEMLHRSALTVAERLSSRREPSARWIGADAARELSGATALNIFNRHEHQRSSKKP